MSAKPFENSKGNAALQAWLRALEMTGHISGDQSITFPALIERLADKFGTAPALLGDEDCMTYRALAERCNRYARWALKQRLTIGDVVCLLMPNCPEYMAIWLGITRIGGIVSLINTNLVGSQLAYSINIAKPKHIIVGGELADTLDVLLPQLPSGLRYWAHGRGSHGFQRIDHEIRCDADDWSHTSEYQPPSIADPALYIYTSGTTGLPKAAKVSHFRLIQWTHWFAGMLDTRPTDRMYNCLPMYHSVGGVVATGATLVNGGSVVLRERFSASRFWDEITDWNCTLFQYIGELCRYLVNSRPHPREANHQLRLCCGNGLRPDIWQEFQRRFRVPQILEFYAATEGTFSLYNCEGKPGAIGRIPSFLAHRFPVALVKFDLETGEPVRNEDGFCIRCCVDEVGEAIGKIFGDGSRSAGRFEGYTDEEASSSKVLRNVFINGDGWFRTGDLMRKDEKGYYYFVDRVGDTFRWKGENVSTTEVADTISAYPGVSEATVYGVEIPGMEGRVGMAAVVVSQDFDMIAFRQHLTKRLPEYARPMFLRVRAAIEMTATFKPKKQELSRDGYNPAVTADVIYFNDRVREAFERLDDELYRRIRSGKVRL
jgi:fatty-acyl-CoA synthase